jgi:bifunctional NMN adenylyltransferase/nudix hydrolase
MDMKTVMNTDGSVIIESNSSVTINANSVSIDASRKLNHKYDFLVYIGRFQPFHLGHLHVVEHALNISHKLIIVIGSHNKPIDWKNPWTSSQRIEMIKAALTPEQLTRVHFQVVEDRLYQDKEWQASVYEAVDAILMDYSTFRVNARDPAHKAKMGLVGFEKDSTSWYLKAFPEWKLEETEAFKLDASEDGLSATNIRDMIYDNHFGYAKALMPEATYNYVREWTKTPAAQYVRDWHEMDKNYQKPYEVLPHGTNFNCSDNVVFQNGRVLMIRRKKHPGKGLWALPGGHVMLNETSLQAGLRELKEETQIKVPEKVLRGSLVDRHVFDHPERSLRGRCGKIVGRTISNSFCYNLENGNLAHVKAADDAEEAWWFTLVEIRNMKDQIFEDHYSQIEYYVSRI